MKGIVWAAIVSLLAVSLVFSFRASNIQTNLFALLPAQTSKNIPQQAIDKYSEKLSRKVIFLVSSSDEKLLFERANLLNKRLVNSKLFAEINFRLSDADLRAIYESFEPYQFNLLNKVARKELQANPQKWLANKLLHQFISPVAGMNSDSLKKDPFGLYRDFLLGLPAGNSKAEIRNGYTLFHADKQVHLLITAELTGSAFSQGLQNSFNNLTVQVSENDNNDAYVTVFGVIRYALENRLLAQQEISTIGAGSLLGIISIFFFVFRRISLLAIILLPVAIGLLSAFSVSMLLFGEIHLVSLVFAASLIGVSIDYTLHYCCSNSNLTATASANESLREVLSALTIGLLTSILGYLTLSITDFPALRQMSALAVAGLAGAYFTVLFWLPILVRKQLTVQAFVVTWVDLFTKWIKSRKEMPIWLVISIILAGFAVNYMIKNSQDDIKIMRAHLPELESIETKVQEIVGEFPNSQYFLVRARTPELTTHKEQELIRKIKETTTEGRVYALSEWLPDGTTQANNYRLLRSSIISDGELDRYITEAGFPVDILSEYRSRLAKSQLRVMGVQEFLKSPLGRLHSQLWLGKLDDYYYSIVGLYGYKDLAALNAIAEASPDIYFIDRSASVSHIFEKYREKIERMFPLVIFVIFLLLSWRYGVAGSFRIVSAPVISALLSFLLINLMAGEYNLFVIFGLVITVAISIDYAVFIRESKGDNKSTYLAISLASLTTILALGLLSMSHTPALSFFGLSLLLGVILSFILTPLIVKPGPVAK